MTRVVQDIGPTGRYWQRLARCVLCGRGGLQVVQRQLRTKRLVNGRRGPLDRVVFAAYCPSCDTEHGDHDTISGALRAHTPAVGR